MKFIFFISLNFLIFTQFSYSQENTNIDQRLLVKYSAEEIQNLKTTQPQLIDYEIFKLDNSWYLIDIESNSDKPYPMLCKMDFNTKSKGEIVDNIDEENFNLLEYYIEQQYDRRIVYKIGNTGLGLVVLPEKETAEKFNKILTEK